MASAPLPLIPWSKTNLLSERSSTFAIGPVLKTFIDLYILGYLDHANRLIGSIWEHSHGLEYGKYSFGRGTMKIMSDAWDCTKTMPAYIKNPAPDKIFQKIPGCVGFEDDNRWEQGSIAWEHSLPDRMKDNALKRKFTVKDLQYARERINREPEKDPDWNFTVGAAVQIAIIAGKEDVARDIIKEHVPELYRHVQEDWSHSDIDGDTTREWLNHRMGIETSPDIWVCLKDAEIGRTLKVDEKSLDAFISEGCALIKQRFTQGPSRPLADKSVSELVKIMDENYIAARKANPQIGGHMGVYADEVPDSFLASPLTDDEITALEERLSNMLGLADDSDDEEGDGTTGRLLPDKHLPDDYKEFLRITDGLQTKRRDQTGIFFDAETVGTDDADHLHDMDFTLLPYDYTTLDDDMDNISLGSFNCFSIGYGGDEGTIAMIPPSSVRPVLQAFEKAYAVASEKNKRLYERAATDLYGGLDAVRALEWLVVVFYHWDPNERIYGSFKEYLEEVASESIRTRKDDEKGAKEKRKKQEEEDDIKKGQKRKGAEVNEDESDSKDQRKS